ncbi:MAG: 5-(carboxyamino)imidazole ribonucleotide mutase [Desulfuromonadales bacterium]
MNNKPLVGILMGSDNDYEIMKEAALALHQFGIPFEMTVSSAHRTPERTATFVREAKRAMPGFSPRKCWPSRTANSRIDWINSKPIWPKVFRARPRL